MRTRRRDPRQPRRRRTVLAKLYDDGVLDDLHMRAAEEIDLVHELSVFYGVGGDLGATRVDQACFANPHVRRLQVLRLHYVPWVRACLDPLGPWKREGPAVRAITEAVVARNLSLYALESALALREGAAQRFLAEGLSTYASIAKWTE